jgi:hypothetical protein
MQPSTAQIEEFWSEGCDAMRTSVVQDSSPLRRALSRHFSQYEGLLEQRSPAQEIADITLRSHQPAGDDGISVQDREYPIYKDTSNGNAF